jgi:hypothetical protein
VYQVFVLLPNKNCLQAITWYNTEYIKCTNWKGKGEFYPRKGHKNAERNKGIDILDLVRCLRQISAALLLTMVFVTHCAVNRLAPLPIWKSVVCLTRTVIRSPDSTHKSNYVKYNMINFPYRLMVAS